MPFCHPETNEHPGIERPFTKGEFTYATNGRVLVWVPAVDGVIGTTHKLPDAQKTIAETPLPDTPFADFPKLPFDAGYEGPCPNCRCNGDIFERRWMRIDGVGFRLEFLAPISRLPHVRYSVVSLDGDSGVMWFEFEGGGRGILKSIKVPAGHSDHNLWVPGK